MRSCRLVAGAAAVALALLGLLASAASAQDQGWVVESFDVTVAVSDDGSFRVREAITVDFGGLEKHGIFRVIPVRYGLPAEVRFPLPEGRSSDELVRAIDVDDIRVSSETAPDEVELERPDPFPDEGQTLRMRIGDPDETISGRHTYVISYRVAGAMNGFGAPPELLWDVTGDAWPVPIASATATVSGAGERERVACFRGQFGMSETCSAEAGPDGATFRADALLPGEGMTAVVGFAAGSVDVPAPILLERWSFRRAFAGSGWALPVALVLTVLGLGGVAALLRREGRDRVARGGVTVDGRLEPGEPSRRLGLFEARTVPVQFRPPEGLRPAQVGLLIDERVDAVDISATVVDLAVRGHLLIEEEESDGWRSRTDWVLSRTDAARDPGDPLLPHEQKLLDGLFADGDRVKVSELEGEFAETYKEVEGDLYELGRDEGWFARRPDRVRAMWIGIGVGLLALGGTAFVLGMLFTTVAVVALPIVLVGLTLAVAARWMPHRTPKGSRLLTGVLGFREFIVTAETDRMEFAEAEKLFVSYLPYAVVFGAVDRWAKVFGELGISTATAVGSWYVGAHAFDAARFSSGLSDFSSSLGTSLSTAPATGGSSGFSSGGFSGGGFGGGGGGSW